MFCAFPTSLERVPVGLFHSVIPQFLLVLSPTVSNGITEIQEESTDGDIDLEVFYTPLNRD